MRHGEGTSSACAEAKTQEAIQALARIGFRERPDPAVVSRLVELGKRMEQLREKTEWAESIAGLEDVDFFVKQDVALLAKLLTLSDKEFTEHLYLVREHCKPVRSLVEKPPAIAASGWKG